MATISDKTVSLLERALCADSVEKGLTFSSGWVLLEQSEKLSWLFDVFSTLLADVSDWFSVVYASMGSPDVVTLRSGGGRAQSLAIRLRFCTVAMSKNSSLALASPRNLNRVKRK